MKNFFEALFGILCLIVTIIIEILAIVFYAVSYVVIFIFETVICLFAFIIIIGIPIGLINLFIQILEYLF